MSAAIILPYDKEFRGRDSSRVIAISPADGSGLPKILVNREMFEGQEVLRLPGGKCHANEGHLDCARREFIEETGYRRSDGRSKFFKVFTYGDDECNHDTAVFMCGFLKKPKLKMEKNHWINLSEVISLWEDYKGPDKCPIEPKHIGYLRESFLNPRHQLLERIKDHVTVQQKVKSAS